MTLCASKQVFLVLLDAWQKKLTSLYPKTDPPTDDAPAPDDGTPDDATPDDAGGDTPAPPTPAPTTEANPTEEPEPIDGGGDEPTEPVATTPSLGGGNMTPQPTPAIYQPDRDSLAPHKDNIADTIGELEKSELDKLNGAEIFGITVGVLAFICIIGFCFGRKCARWCMKREMRHSDKNERQPFPLNDQEQEML